MSRETGRKGCRGKCQGTFKIGLKTLVTTVMLDRYGIKKVQSLTGVICGQARAVTWRLLVCDSLKKSWYSGRHRLKN